MKVFSRTSNAFRANQRKRMYELVCRLRNDPDTGRLLRWRGTPELYIFDDPKLLGEYRFKDNTILLSERLMVCKSETVDSILKHEVAHFLAMTTHGPSIEPHGKEFKEACRVINADPSAKMNLEKHDENAKAGFREEALLNKVKKLFKLSESSNKAESQSALNKANELITKHNLQYAGEETEKFYQADAYEGPRINAKYCAMAFLVKDLFDVYPVWKKGRRSTTLTLNGKKEAVEVATYVFEFLDGELERLYNRAKKEYGLKGKRAKNNYIESLCREFVDRSKAYTEKETDESQRRELVKVKQAELEELKEVVFDNKLRSTTSSRGVDPEARQAGKKDSSKLSIRKGMGSSAAQKRLA